jgi:NadR type nicotinamide-nucleotide adenylyltransferase
MNAPLLRVAILGPESSGKSTLAETLAMRHQTLWVPEYLREFVDTEGRVPVAADQFHIAATQRDREDAAAASAGTNKYLFCDTAPLMTAVYSRHYFGGIDDQLAPLADRHPQDYAMTLVASPDIPWVADGLQRDSEEVTAIIYRMLLDELAARGIPYLLVSGELDQRLSWVEKHL